MKTPLTKEGVRRERDPKRANGIYYTPPPIAAEVTKWAVNGRGNLVLDPSYGGGVFVAASLNRLSLLGSDTPGRQVFGVDSDVGAEARTRGLTKKAIPRRHLVNADFFSVVPRDFNRRFDAVVGNPPYVKHHDIDPQLLHVARERVAEQGFSLSGRSSYWAYFVLHALQFVSPGGKLALILPGALLHADYAASVREAILENFGRVTIVAIDEKVFSDAREESVILLAERRGESCREVRVGGLSERHLRLEEATLRRCTRRVAKAQWGQSWMRAMLDGSTLSTYEELGLRSVKLGNIATVRIGAVTGANEYFTLRPSELREAGIPTRYAQPMITRATQIRVSRFTEADMKSLLNQDAKALLFRPPKNGKLHPKVAEYVELGESLGLQNRYKCSRRKPWYVVPDSPPPDAFLLYMTSIATRLVLNEAGASCTNAIHAVTWRDASRASPASAALASLTTLAQLGAELEGRSYGDGVLKIEPSAAHRLPLPVDERRNLKQELARADLLLRSGRAEDATRLADRTLLSRVTSEKDLGLLREAVFKLRNRRIRRGSSRPTS